MKKLSFVFLSLLTLSFASFAQTDSFPDLIRTINGKTFVYDVKNTVPDSAGNIKPVAVFNKLSIPAGEKIKLAYFKKLSGNPGAEIILKTENAVQNAHWKGLIPEYTKNKNLVGKNDTNSNCSIEWVYDLKTKGWIPLFLVALFFIISTILFSNSLERKKLTAFIMQEISATLMIAAGIIVAILYEHAPDAIGILSSAASACFALSVYFINFAPNMIEMKNHKASIILLASISFILIGMVLSLCITPFWVGFLFIVFYAFSMFFFNRKSLL